MVAKSPEIFRLIGSIQFGLIREIYCDLCWGTRVENTDDIFGMLEDFATCHPIQEIKNVPLEVEPAQ